ncbi:DUF3413 domain-containing protein [Motilimonas sp. 1_MG-2023]|uniref:DUF3413 domain-containing protein n=1 Tax=Motilimonas sp. 1_MG-2023 TaxID=3062672 RepID=UPI0026E14B54|nr:DUF3413 domain-containing protein [Motilimonas sp. 1_MG-2023]MDO6524760.1 DUF3413 domain-containing protein [Motilimonas sp. 1_MG-2023]
MDNVSKLISWGHWFSSINILFALIIAIRYLVAAEWPPTFLGQSYLLISWLGHFSFISFAFYLVFIFPISFFVPYERILRLLAVFASTAGLTILLLDTQSFSLFRFHLNPLMWQYLFNDNNPSTANLLFIAIPFIFLLQLTASELIWRNLRPLYRANHGPKIAVVLIIAFLLTHLVNIWADATFYRPITMQKANFPLSYPMTAKSFLIRQGWVDEAEIRAHQNPHHEGRTIKYPLREIEHNLVTQHPNVVVVMVDALRADMLNKTNMPNLSRLAQMSTEYQSHFSGGNYEDLGIYSFFYGLPGRYWPDIEQNKTPSVLLSSLQQAGYELGLFSSNQAPSLQAIAANSQLNVSTNEGALKGDINAIKQWQEWQANNQTKPSFSFLYFTAASAMETPPNYPELFSPTTSTLKDKKLAEPQQQEALFNRYKNAISYTDILLAQVFDRLTETNQFDNSIIIVTGAYGQEFNDLGTNQWGNHSNYGWPQTQVPLVIHWPGQTAQKIEQDTSHLDLVPTLMEQVLATKTPSRFYSTGQNLLEPLKRNYILMGDDNDYVVYQKDSIIELNAKGDTYVLDRGYNPIPKAEPDVAVLMQVLNDLRRFYPAK